MKIGSLFDGSGGFPLAGSMCGFTPVWASEVEPYPIAVTKSRFPNMKHLGDISKINGAEIEPVDIITFGSPCQDMSVAGKRAGLKHQDNGDEETTRSGLFMEAVRIIKEMRKVTNGKYPRFAVWENVPGAFSSNKGEDFRLVLEELIKVTEPNAVMPEVPKKGWAYADTYCGDGWSIAYRVFDAQYWGVPQRRRRIYLVADFRGQCAEEILFKRNGLRGYFEESREQGKDVTADAERSIGTDDSKGKGIDGYNGELTGDISSTLGVNCGMSTGRNGVIGFDRYNQCLTGEVSETLRTPGGGDNYPVIIEPIAYGISSYDSNAMKSSNPHSGIYEADTAKTLDLNGGNPACNQGGIAVVEKFVLDDQGGSQINVRTDGKSPTLRAETHGNLPCVMSLEPGIAVYSVENNSADSRVDIDESGKVQTLTSRMGTGGGNVPMVMHPPVAYSINHQGGNVEQIIEDKTGTLTASMNSSGNNKLSVAYGIDQGASRDVGDLFLEECSKTITNGSCPGHHNGVVVAYGLDRASFNRGQNAKYDFSITEEQAPTMVAKCPGAVCCTTGSFMQATEEVRHTLPSQDGENVTCFSTGEYMSINENIAPTLLSRDYKDPNCICTNYIVRRLTPTEYARLQGFPDMWGHPIKKDSLTDDEYAFWHEVRDTYDIVIKGKDPKDLKVYNKKQMLAWYNKLHNDSSEYKMWGNGIALPNALYVMQGIENVVKEETIARSKWLDALLRS